MEKKYEILKNTKKYYLCRKVYRIKSLKDFGNVKKGDIGGFVESEDNLSQEGDCWIYDNAIVCDNSIVKDYSKVYGNSKVCFNSTVSGNSIICSNSTVYNYAVVKDYATVSGNSTVKDYAVVKNYATVSGNSIICGNSIVCDNAKIKDYAIVSGNSTVYNHVVVRSHAKINNHAKIKDENQWFVVENVGSRNDNITFYETDNVIYANVGCFSGTLDEFIKQVKITHKGNKFEKEYLQMAELAKVKLGGLNE